MTTFARVFAERLRAGATSSDEASTVAPLVFEGGTNSEFLEAAAIAATGHEVDPATRGYLGELLDKALVTRPGAVWRLLAPDMARSPSRGLHHAVSAEVTAWDRLLQLMGLGVDEERVILIMAVYRALLGRRPDPDGFLGHYRALDDGYPAARLSLDVAASDEAGARRTQGRGKRLSDDALLAEVERERYTLELLFHSDRGVARERERAVSHLQDEILTLRNEIRDQFEEVKAWVARLDARLDEIADLVGRPE